MISGWVVDTNLMVDWCLWALGDDTASGSIAEAATQQLSKLSLGSHRDALERHLAPVNVLLAASVLVETAVGLRRRLGHAHTRSDSQDRLNEPIIKATHRFIEYFDAKLVAVTEVEASKCLKRLNRRVENLESEKPIDFGDAALIATLTGERKLLTADERLFERCVSIGRTDVFFFDKGTSWTPLGSRSDRGSGQGGQPAGSARESHTSST